MVSLCLPTARWDAVAAMTEFTPAQLDFLLTKNNHNSSIKEVS